MKRVDDSPLPSLCCELSPMMSYKGKRLYHDYEGDCGTKDLQPLLCQFCKQQVCEDCWNEGKHFIKTYVCDGINSYGMPDPVRVSREMPQCINPWRNMLLKAKAKL